MSEERVKKIKERIKYLKRELINENYWDGFTAKGFRDELKKLEEELKGKLSNLK